MLAADAIEAIHASHQELAPSEQRSWRVRSFVVRLAGYNFMVATVQG